MQIRFLLKNAKDMLRNLWFRLKTSASKIFVILSKKAFFYKTGTTLIRYGINFIGTVRNLWTKSKIFASKVFAVLSKTTFFNKTSKLLDAYRVILIDIFRNLWIKTKPCVAKIVTRITNYTTTNKKVKKMTVIASILAGLLVIGSMFSIQTEIPEDKETVKNVQPETSKDVKGQKNVEANPPQEVKDKIAKAVNFVDYFNMNYFKAPRLGDNETVRDWEIREFAQYGSLELGKQYNSADEFDRPAIRKEIDAKKNEIRSKVFRYSLPYSTSDISVKDDKSSVTIRAELPFYCNRKRLRPAVTDVIDSLSRKGCFSGFCFDNLHPFSLHFLTKDDSLRGPLNDLELGQVRSNGGYIYIRLVPFKVDEVTRRVTGDTETIKKLVRNSKDYQISVIFENTAFGDILGREHFLREDVANVTERDDGLYQSSGYDAENYLFLNEKEVPVEFHAKGDRDNSFEGVKVDLLYIGLVEKGTDNEVIILSGD